MCCWPAHPRPMTATRSGCRSATVDSRIDRSSTQPWSRTVDHLRRNELQAGLRARPLHRVGQNPLDIGVPVHRVLLITGREVEDLALAAPPATARPEDLASAEAGDEDQFIGAGDVEVLAVHLLLADHDRLRHSPGYGMGRRHRPNEFNLSGIAPCQRAGGAHQPDEDLGEVRGVQDQQAHAAENALMHPIDHLIINLSVGGVAPPGQHVCTCQHLPRQSVLWLILGGGTNLDCCSHEVTEPGRDRAMHSLWISLRHAGSISFKILVIVLAPDGDTDRTHDRSVCQVQRPHEALGGPRVPWLRVSRQRAPRQVSTKPWTPNRSMQRLKFCVRPERTESPIWPSLVRYGGLIDGSSARS